MEFERTAKLEMARNERDHEISEDKFYEVKSDLLKTLANMDGDISETVPKLTDFGIPELETSDQVLKKYYDEYVKKSIKENNLELVSKMLTEDVLNTSLSELEKEENSEETLPTLTEVVREDEPTTLRRLKRIAERNKKPYDKNE